MPTVKINTCDKNWFGRDYIFYDKSGNPINILYDEELGMYRGKLYFPEGSSDTFEELEINTFERIRGFEYQQYDLATGSTVGTDELYTQKFQLFNTEGISFVGNTQSCQVTRIENVNNRQDFYSKWVYGESIDLLFPHGSEVFFSMSLFSIVSDESYTVVNSKQNAILIITPMDNKTFETTFGGLIDDSSQYTNLTVSGINVIKIYNYIDEDYVNVFPDWSEPNFYNQLFNDQRLTIVNSNEDNDGVYTISNKSLGDNYYNDYKILVTDLDGDFTIRVKNKTANFNVYKGSVIFGTNSTVTFGSEVPDLIKPDSRFHVPSSSLNNKTLTADSVSVFNQYGITNYFEAGTQSLPDQVLYESDIYHCVLSYTQSATSSITPLDGDYWTESNFLYVKETLNAETLINANVFLKDNEIDLDYNYDTNETSRVNLAKAFNIHSDSFDDLGLRYVLDPIGEWGILKSKWATNYVEVEYLVDKLDTFSGSSTDGTNFSPTGYTFSYDPYQETDLTVKVDGNVIMISEDYLSSSAWVYFTDAGTSSSQTFDSLNSNSGIYWKETNASFGLTAGSVMTVAYTSEVAQKERIIERVVQVSEDLNDELREDYSYRPERRIVITDIDEYGLIVTINEQVYAIESTILYNDSGEIDLDESIDQTIKEWISRWRLELDKRGIFISAQLFGNNNVTSLFNTILIRGTYPNIQLNVSVKVGDTADFFFPETNLIVYQMGSNGSQFSLTINNRQYLETYAGSVESTLTNWIITHQEFLEDFGIYIERKNQSLLFKKKEDFDIEIVVNVGLNFLPGEKVWEFVDYWKTNEGLIITSNRIAHANSEVSFEEECFSTGQIISINNSEWIVNNQEYNIIYLDPDRMLLSYQGPFWGSLDDSLQSAFFQLAFGDDLEVGDYLVAIVSGISWTASVTKVAGSSYEILYNVNQVATIPRTQAFYYDAAANNITGSASADENITYISSDSGMTDVDYFDTKPRLSLTSDQVSFLDSKSIRIDGTIGLSQSVIKQVINPYNDLLYVLTQDWVYIIDPSTEQLLDSISNLGTEGWDIACDWSRGDVYVSYGGTGSSDDRIMVIDSDLNCPSTDFYSGFSYGKLTFNRDEDYVYVFSRVNEDIGVTASKVIYRIDLENGIFDSSFLISATQAIYLGLGSTGSSEGYLGGGQYLDGEIHYNEFNSDMYIANGGTLNRINTSTDLLEDLGIDIDTYYSTSLDTFNKRFWLLNSSDSLYYINEDESYSSVGMTYSGYIHVNPIDSNIYIATQDGSNELQVYSTFLNQIFYTFNLNWEPSKIEYNRHGESYLGINSSQSEIVNITVSFIYNDYKAFSNGFNQSQYIQDNLVDNPNFSNPETENQYGTLDIDYIELPYLQIKTREFIRKPRQNYSTTGAPQVDWVFSWEDDTIEDMFMVDITGDHLPDSGSYAYIGETPLENPIIRRTPNIILNNVDKSWAQQTVFDILTYSLDYNDSNTNISFVPEGIQTILGFNSKTENVKDNVLYITQHEDISLSYSSYDSFTSSTFSALPTQVITFIHNDDTGYGEIYLNQDSTETWAEVLDYETFVGSDTNLDVDQLINIRVKDYISEIPYTSQNDNIDVRIIEKYERTLIVKYLGTREFASESTLLIDYPTDGDQVYLKVELEVLSKDIVKIDIYGQTEIEDIRYKTELSNTGKLINPEDIFIFKEYDINEGGIDWRYMNKKRKEMLMVRNDIYNYIGAYRSIINAINFFGYNDLELYEYFQNINVDSNNYLKLNKVEIPDIFDNSTDTWSENYRYYQFPNKNFEETKLFNLTYKITDFDGNKLISYSLEEALIKLMGLKKWLKRNIVPITHKILDITGRSDFRDDNLVFDTPSQVKFYRMNDYITPVDFDLNETYVLPVQSGSTVYNNVIDFSIGETESHDPDFFELELKTYKIYEEWDPFVSYDYTDKIRYFGILYENVLLDPTADALGQDPTDIKNTNNNPKFYENSDAWDMNTTYDVDDIVVHNRRYYKYSLQTQEANYLPWEGATGSCLTGTPSQTNDIDDNFYQDLVDRIGEEPNVPDYWNVPEDNVDSNFDVLDIVRNNYPSNWCTLILKDDTLISLIVADMINLSEDQYQGDKPTTISEATVLIIQMIDDFVSTKTDYKFKFIELNPEENVAQTNVDFILWDDITEWLEIDMEPVQRLTEYRSGDDMLLPFNFTLDTSIDPFILIKVTTSNGYGQIICNKKSYEIRYDADDDSVLVKTIR